MMHDSTLKPGTTRLPHPLNAICTCHFSKNSTQALSVGWTKARRAHAQGSQASVVSFCQRFWQTLDMSTTTNWLSGSVIIIFSVQVVIQEAANIVKSLQCKEDNRERASFASTIEWREVYSIAHKLHCLRHATSLPVPRLRENIKLLQNNSAGLQHLLHTIV